MREKETIQDKLYNAPYHYLPHEDPAGVWRIARHLYWGYRYLALLEKVKELVLSHRPHRVMDFGCGDGRLMKELVEAGITDIVGIDFSDRAINFAKNTLSESNKVSFYKSLDQIPDGIGVDVIVAMEVLEHVHPGEMAKILGEFKRVLRPSGSLVLTVPTTIVPTNPKHYRHFSAEDLIKETEGMFTATRMFYVHRIGLLDDLIRRMIINRFFMANYDPWLRFTTWLYRRFVMDADATTGAHIVANFKRAV